MAATKSQLPQADVDCVAFVSLGCPKNLVDSEKMLGLLAQDGIAITPDHADADAIVINTCGFLEASKEESLSVIREALAEKKAAAKHGHAKRVIVAGCLVQRHREELLKEVPGVDALVGVFDRENIVKAVRGRFDAVADTGRDMGQFHSFIHKPSKADIGKGYLESDQSRLRLTPRHYAYLRVSEGCNQGCTFCTIPSIRGRMRSKPLADILAEADELMTDGAFELNLIGQDTTSYGQDIGYEPGLPGMLRALNQLVRGRDGNGWIRLMYAYPSCFTDEMIRTLWECEHVVKYIDMPLQHINDDVLFAMRRKVTRKQTETLLEKLRKWVPGMTLRTTLISGFPGETEAQHQELLQFVKDFEFECLGVFEYSPEPGTPAGRLWEKEKIPAQEVARRKEEIMLAQQAVVLKKNGALVGRKISVLVDEINPRKKSAIARHTGQAPDIDGRVLIQNATARPGDLVQVRVDDFNYYDLIATETSPSKTTRKREARPLSLPVVGAVHGGVETKGKRG